MIGFFTKACLIDSMSDLRMIFKKLYFVAYHTTKIDL